MTFEQPADGGGAYVPWKEVELGSVMVFAPKTFMKDHATNFGPKDTMVGDVGILSGPLAGKIYKNAYVTQAQMVDATKSALGKMVLGRLGNRQPKNPGYKPYWTIEKWQAGDEQLAERFVTQFKDFGHGDVPVQAEVKAEVKAAPPVTNPNWPTTYDGEGIPF